MIKIPVDFDGLTQMDTDIAALSSTLAQALSALPSQDRNAKIDAIWPQIDHYRAAYTQGVLNLRNSVGGDPRDAAQQRRTLVLSNERIGFWDAVAHMIWRQSLPSSFPPLITTRREFVSGRSFGPVNYLLDVMFHEANAYAPDRSLLPDTHYRDIPLSGAYFLNVMEAAQRLLLARGHTGPERFLDMGCGGGTKVLGAMAKFEVAHGVDFLLEYITEAKAFFGKVGADPNTVWQADALSFETYSDYDIVYLYRPLQDIDLATIAEKRILDQVKPGTIIIAPLNQTFGPGGEHLARIEENIYLAHTTWDDAIQLKEIALTKGSETRISNGVSDDVLGFWAPIVDQSRLNGFALF